MLKKITSLAIVAIGVVVLILGLTMRNTEVESVPTSEPSFSASTGYYSVPSAKFGADFYTYMYDAFVNTVDALNDISWAMPSMVKAQNATVEAINSEIKAVENLQKTGYSIGGMILAAIGLAIIASGVGKVGEAFAPEQPASQKTTAPALTSDSAAAEAPAAVAEAEAPAESVDNKEESEEMPEL